MSAAPEWFMSELPRKHERAKPAFRAAPGDEAPESSHASWGWVAVGVLVVCWIAEASLCAARGF